MLSELGGALGGGGLIALASLLMALGGGDHRPFLAAIALLSLGVSTFKAGMHPNPHPNPNPN